MTEITIDVAETCERKECEQDSTHAWIVTGDVGEDGIVAYCPAHSQSVAEVNLNYTYLTEVSQ